MREYKHTYSVRYYDNHVAPYKITFYCMGHYVGEILTDDVKYSIDNYKREHGIKRIYKD